MSKEISSEKELLKIGERLRALRKAKGFSNPDKFAWANGLDRSQYGKYEAGRTNLTINSLVKILNCLDLTLEDFFASKPD